MEFNWIAMLVAALVPTIIGFVWYNPKVFGSIWMRETGMTEGKMQGANMALIFGLSFLFSFMLSFAMNNQAVHDLAVMGATYYETGGTMEFEPGSDVANWVDYYKTTLAPANHSFKHGAAHLLMVTLFLILPIFATNALYERRSWKYVAVNVGYWLVTLMIMGGIIAAWR